MSNPNYCVITVANCDPKFMNKALDLTEGFKKEIELKANPVSIRYGVMSTGQYAGAIAFFQNYASLADFEKSFGVYQAANDYQALFNSGNASVIMRNIVKYLDDFDLYAYSSSCFFLFAIKEYSLFFNFVLTFEPCFLHFSLQ